jgi:hypothetical protein
MPDVPPDLGKAIYPLLRFLIAGNLAEVVRMSGGVRLSRRELEMAIQEYGRTLVPLPEWASESWNIVEVRDTLPRQWSVWIPLWTKEEGRSDLTLGLTLIQDGSDYRIEVDDLHVP